MEQPISPEEAAEALRQIEVSKATFRKAVGASRGYQILWLWGCIWITECMASLYAPQVAGRLDLALTIAGSVASVWMGCAGNKNIRAPRDRRFLAVLVALIVGGFLWPTLLVHGGLTPQANATYSVLVTMQCYVIAGIWFDSYLTAIGLITAALVLVGYWFFLPVYWWWTAITGGGSLLVGGFYIRNKWK